MKKDLENQIGSINEDLKNIYLPLEAVLILLGKRTAFGIALELIDSLHQEMWKPAEWDELQSEFKNINEAFEDGKKEVIDHPEKYCLCKSAEWSEEDEDKLEQCIKIVSGWEGDYDIVKSPYSNFLKSLRPSWKPSEEQMDALLWCTAHLGGEDHRVLAELYEHLKML